MTLQQGPWIKPFFTLLILFLFVLVLPNAPLDPWSLLNLKKVATMIFALALIHVLGSLAAQLVGAKAGAILTGFLGGLISSTATTVALARESRNSSSDTNSIGVLTFLSATGAMLLEGTSLLLVGTNEIHPSLFLIFLGPILMTIIMILLESRTHKPQNIKPAPSLFKILPIVKLSAFIVTILIFSKLLQHLFGQNGLFIFTFLVSLFEIHGSVIANIQLHDAGAFDIPTLGHLLALSIIASYVSKLFLIAVLGRAELRKKVLRRTFFLFLSLAMSWAIFLLSN